MLVSFGMHCMTLLQGSIAMKQNIFKDALITFAINK